MTIPIARPASSLSSGRKIRAGEFILDAGSGLCGPSIEICSQVDGVANSTITISARQARVARDLVAAAGLSDRIAVHVGDYHDLPLEDAIFDIVLFLESAGYCRDLRKLYAEAYQSTSAAMAEEFISKIYFGRRKNPLLSAQRKELNVFDRLYVYATEPVTAHVEALRKAGFRHVETATLSTLVTMDRINDAMWDNGGGRRRLSAFGRVHYSSIEGSSDRILRGIRAQKD